MNARIYTADDFVEVFGDNYGAVNGATPGLMIPLNALHSAAEEIGVLSLAANEQHVDFEIVLIRLARRMELAAELGHVEILALVARVQQLEAKLAATAEAKLVAVQ